MCRVYFNQTTMEKSTQKIEKIKNYPNVRKSCSTSRKGTGGRKNKKKISKSKTTTLTYLII